MSRLIWSAPRRSLRGIRTTLAGLGSSVGNKQVQRSYLGALLLLVAITWALTALGIWGIWYFIPVGDKAGFALWLHWLFRVVTLLATVVLSPVLALPITQLVAPAFSGAPFFAHLEVMAPERTAELLASPGMSARAGVWMTLRRLPSFFFFSALFLAVGLIPLVGPPAAAVGHLVNAARMVRWELLEPYLDARLMDEASRRGFMKRYQFETLGFGLICAPLLGLPVIGPFFFGWLQAATARLIVDIIEPELRKRRLQERASPNPDEQR